MEISIVVSGGQLAAVVVVVRRLTERERRWEAEQIHIRRKAPEWVQARVI